MSLGISVILVCLLSIVVELSHGFSKKSKFDKEIQLLQLEPSLRYFGGTVDPALYEHNDRRFEENRTSFEYRSLDEIPENFDSRKEWPYCDSIKEVRNQGSCGSCWAVAAAATMSDRVCIASEGKIQFQFSADDILTCCGDHCFGNPSDHCGGGKANTAWEFWAKDGVVSGGEYKSNQGCKPYAEQSFLHHSTTPCKKQCTNVEYNVPYPSNKRYGHKFFAIRSKNVKEIQQEMLKNGPLEGFLDITMDFIKEYKDSVYTCPTNKSVPTMGHSVKMVGWGVENKVPYWLVANTWGPKWGKLGGFFKILRGKNECRIEFYVVGGSTNLKNFARGLPSNPSKSKPVAKPTSRTHVSTSARIFIYPFLLMCLCFYVIL